MIASAEQLVARLTSEQRLLLRATLLDGEAARSAWDEWRATVVIDDVDGASQRLLPLLARRLGEIAPDADDPVRSLVRGIYRHAWVRSQRLWRDAQPVFAALRARGIPVMVLKGIALLPVYGGDWGARPMYDVDALVRPVHAPVAFGVLEELGWTPEYDMTYTWIRDRAFSRRHGWGFLRDDGRLDVHWHVLSESLGSRADQAFWATAVPLRIDGMEPPTVSTLAPADLLLHLVVHGVTGSNAPALQWVADALHVIRAHGAGLFAEPFTRQARAHGELDRVRAAFDAIGILLEPRTVAPIVAKLRRAHASTLERLRAGSTAASQLAQRAAGGNGLARGTAELVADRLDLGLAGSKPATVAYAATGRSALGARLASAVGGRGAATAPGGAAAPLGDGEHVDFTDHTSLDRYGGRGWGRPEDEGTTTRGGEADLVLPLADALKHGDLECVLDIHDRNGGGAINVRAGGRRIARIVVGDEPRSVSVVVPAALVARPGPLELSLLRVPTPPFGLRGALALRLSGLTVRRSAGATGRALR